MDIEQDSISVLAWTAAIDLLIVVPPSPVQTASVSNQTHDFMLSRHTIGLNNLTTLEARRRYSIM